MASATAAGAQRYLSGPGVALLDILPPAPVLVDAGAVCQPRVALEGNFDYPSGHTSWGTAVALILAELVHDRAEPIFARGRECGGSRIVCGAHNASAVARAGRRRWRSSQACTAMQRYLPTSTPRGPN